MANALSTRSATTPARSSTRNARIASTGSTTIKASTRTTSGSFKAFKARALSRTEVKQAYAALDEEFAYLDTLLKARLGAGLTQQELAERIGTTQSAVARLESGKGKHSASVATLTKYAKALGKRLVIRFA
jgi:ribosome-binding protein aMBF1 (putative translation factor)